MSVDPDTVGSHLESILNSKPQDITYYGKVASLFGLPEFDGAWSSHPLSKIFEVLDKQDANANRPFRTSVVISATSKAPGPGLYEALERLKGIPDPKTKNAREKLWISELNMAYAYAW